jgi:DNA-binding MarR family transcriptional regulator
MMPFPGLLYIITIVKPQCNSDTPALANPLESHLGYQLRRASALLMADLGRRLVPTELSPTEAAVLLIVRANSGCRQGAIGQLLGIKPANMVPLITKLVKAALVHRAKADGRSHALSLTAAGRSRAASVNQLLNRHDAAIQARLDGQSLAGLLSSLARLRN